MSFLQSIWTDLVEKRLWPVALVLVVALVAIPFVITGKSSPAAPLFAGPVATPSPVPGQLGPTALSAPQVRLAQGGAKRRSKLGSLDPFHQPRLPKAKRQVVSAAGTPIVSGGGGGGGSTTSTPSVPPTPPPSTTPSTPPSSGNGGGSGGSTSDYKVTLRVGQAGDLKVHNDVERLTPLPSTLDPFFVFMGVMSDGKTAVFLLSSDAKATGDGTCKPSPTNCQTVEMKAQDVEFFDVSDGTTDGVSTQYELDLTRIVKTHTSGKAVAASAHTATARTGADIVDQTRAAGSSALSGYTFDARAGVVRRRLPSLASVLGDIARAAGS